MKNYELLEKQAAMMRMAEKYGVDDWRKLVQYKDCGWNETTLLYLNNAGPHEYRFAIGVVEGRPVFEGDTLYSLLNGREYQIRLMPGDAENWSWNPPKPKTVMVELPFDFVKANAELNMDALVLHEACRKAVEEMK